LDKRSDNKKKGKEKEKEKRELSLSTKKYISNEKF
jgi:hypothetical protein